MPQLRLARKRGCGLVPSSPTTVRVDGHQDQCGRARSWLVDCTTMTYFPGHRLEEADEELRDAQARWLAAIKEAHEEDELSAQAIARKVGLTPQLVAAILDEGDVIFKVRAK